MWLWLWRLGQRDRLGRRRGRGCGERLGGAFHEMRAPFLLTRTLEALDEVGALVVGGGHAMNRAIRASRWGISVIIAP